MFVLKFSGITKVLDLFLISNACQNRDSNLMQFSVSEIKLIHTKCEKNNEKKHTKLKTKRLRATTIAVAKLKER